MTFNIYKREVQQFDRLVQNAIDPDERQRWIAERKAFEEQNQADFEGHHGDVWDLL